jgi:hypothetical protein
MNKLIRLLLLLFMLANVNIAVAQDVMVLRGSEEEIQCTIVDISDSLIYYRSSSIYDDSVMVIDRFMVEAYSFGKKSEYVRSQDEGDKRAGILRKYKAGETRPGFVILTAGDTVYGNVFVRDIAFNQVELKWSDNSGEVKVYRPGDITGYGYDLMYFEDTELEYSNEITMGIHPKGSLFLELIDSGPARLYQFVTLTYPKAVMMQFDAPPVYYGDLDIGYYIIPPKGKPRFVKGRSVRGNLIRLFEDHEELVEDLINNKPSIEDVPSVVSKYNYWYENLRTAENN